MLLLESLEHRQLLAVTGLGLAGDSLTDEYINEPYGAYAQNWVSLVGEYRSSELPLGEYRPTTISPPDSTEAPWGDLRRAGYEFNWALAGATSFTLLDPDPVPPLLPDPVGQHVLLADAINAGEISHAVLAIGQNDFSPSNSAYAGIYSGVWTEAEIFTYADSVLANIEEALTTINIGGVKLVMSNIIDYGVAPATQAAFPDPQGRARVSAQIEMLNDRIENLALDYGVPIVDASQFAKDVLGPDSFLYGGVEILSDPGEAPNHAFVADGIHPHTISSAIIANNFINAVNVFYGENLTLFTEEEVLGFIPELTYTADTFEFDPNAYLRLPPVQAIPSALRLHSKPGSDFTIFLDFNGNITEGTGWNSGLQEPILIDTPANFTLAEVRRIWEIVAEDFAPFDVNVTTEEPGPERLRRTGPADTQWGVRVVISPTDTHDTCLTLLDRLCGGVAGTSFQASIDEPVYTFSSFAPGAADTSTHEVGHALGLGHHGDGDNEYYPGHQAGFDGARWIAIMGGGAGRISTWSDGSYSGASNSGQNDLETIVTQNGFGYREDDHQNEWELATPLRVENSTQVSMFGIIEREDDVDVFSFEHGGGPLSLKVSPYEYRPNLKVWAGIYDAQGELVTQSLPSDPFAVPTAEPGVSAAFEISFLAAGKYFLKVDGVGSHATYDPLRDRVFDPTELSSRYDIDPAYEDPWTQDPPVGFSDYASLGQYWIEGTVVAPSPYTIDISATDAVKREGNSGNETNFTFTLTRSGPLDGAANVDYLVVPAWPRAQGGAYPHTVDSEDFRSVGFPTRLPSGFASFAAGEATTQIAITVAADSVYEPTEYFEVLLFEPVGETVSWTFENSSAIGEIRSDEVQFFVDTPSVLMSAQEESDDLGGNFVGGAYEFTIIRDGHSGIGDGTIAVPWSVDSTAFESPLNSAPATPNDFVNQNGQPIFDSFGGQVFPSGVALFAPGELAKTVTVYTRADRIAEEDESFQLVLGTPSYTSTSNQGLPLSVHPDLRRARAVIFNEDIVAAPTLSVEARIPEIYERGQTVLVQQPGDRAIATRVTITRDGDILSNPVVVTVTLGEETADEAFLMIGPPGAIDPLRDGPKSIDIPFDADQDVFNNLYLVSVEDAELDGPQTVTLTATADDHVTGIGTATIVDSDGTALDRYVAKPDPSYGFELVDTIDGIGFTTYIIDMTSQTWRTAEEVDNPIWQHWVQIIVPDTVVSETALLVIDGGSRSATPPTATSVDGLFFAQRTNQIVVSLPTVPNQPLVFADDPGNPRVEDAIIAYSYDKFLNGGDEEWPALLPMVKSAVRAMDTTQQFLAEETSFQVDDFFVTGASKRGWTTWLTAAVDDRVSGIAPAVIDVLNMEVSMRNHRENYEGVTENIIGGYARAVRDYTELNVFDRFDTPRGLVLREIVDPFEYRDRYVEIPKFIVNATGDQFFTPDSSLWYFDELPGEKYLWYVPNTDHGLNQEAFELGANFVAATEANAVLPNISWAFEGPLQNTLRVTSDIAPVDVRLWQATRTDSIDFRTETNAPPYTSSSLSPNAQGDYVGTVSVPTTGGTAYFVELTYIINNRPQKFSTQLAIAEPPPPRLVGVNPGSSPDPSTAFSESELNGLPYSPSEFTFSFNVEQELRSEFSGIRFIASGGDETFADGNEIVLVPSSIGFGDNPYTVIASFDQPLPEERYRILITGDDDVASGIIGLRNFNGDGFQGSDGSQTTAIDFEVSLVLDFGDAPDSYGTRLADDGARHHILIDQLPRFGNLVDSEPDGQPVNQDDATGESDEDGLSIAILPGGGAPFSVFVGPGTDPDAVTPADVIGLLNRQDPDGTDLAVHVFGRGFLHAWIDFDQNGQFDPAEHVVASHPVDANPDDGEWIVLHVDVPSDAVVGPTWMRMRISEAEILGPTGVTIGGEVEDYRVDIVSFDPIVLQNDELITAEDTSLVGIAADLIGNDSIPSHTFLPTDIEILQPPAAGTLVFNPLIGDYDYTPNLDFAGTDTFVYRVGPLTASSGAKVTIQVTPVNDHPVFSLDAPLVDGVHTLEFLESGDPAGIVVEDFANDIGPGPVTAIDEVATQAVTFTMIPVSVDAGLINGVPTLSPTGTLTLPALPDAVGTATYTVRASDGVGGETEQTLVIHVRPVNDPPRANPALSGTSDSLNADDQYSVGGSDLNGDGLIDPVITYTLKEDNTQSGGATGTPFFIPLNADATTGYDRVGLLDVLTVGPNDEQAAGQVLSLISAAGQPVSAGARTTDRGGMLTPRFNGSTLIGFDYLPPTDYNSLLGAPDSFAYTVSDDGQSYDLASGGLVSDPQTRTNQVLLVLNPVNDRPFTTLTDRVTMREDTREVVNLILDVGAGPLATAFDEINPPTEQQLIIEVVPLDFPLANANEFFSTYPTIDLDTGTLTVEPADDVFGEFRFDLILRDNGADDPARGDVNRSLPVRLTIEVQPVNDPPMLDPQAAPLEFAIAEDTTIEIPVTGSGGLPGLLDVFLPGPAGAGDESANIVPGGNQTLSLRAPNSTSTAAGGTLQLLTDGGSSRLRYTPPANFNGADSFVYSVIDDGVTINRFGVPSLDPLSALGTVTILVGAVNDPPQFSGGNTVTVAEGTGQNSIPRWATGVFPGPPGADDEIQGTDTSSPQTVEFLFTQTAGDPALFATGPSAAVDPQTGDATLNFELAPTRNGTATFNLVLRDSLGAETAPRSFSINVTAVNDPPTFSFISNAPVTVAEESGPFIGPLLENISPGPPDESSQTVSFEVQPLPAQFAELFSSPPSVNPNGVLTFTPAVDAATGLIGPVPVRILARDSAGAASGLFGFQIVITEVNDPPFAANDLRSGDEDTVLTIDVQSLVANDSDPDLSTNPNEVLTVELIGSTSNSGATVSLDPVTGTITYDPTVSAGLQSLAPGESSFDTFTYRLVDAAGASSNIASVSINISGVNDAPQVLPDTPQLQPSGQTIIDVLANDTDIDGNLVPSSIEFTQLPSFGSITVGSGGLITYTPFDNSFAGEDSFAYTVADNLGARSVPATVTISANASPVAGNDVAETFRGNPVSIDVAGNDGDPDGTLDLTTVLIVDGPTRGTATPRADGRVLYEPAADFIGTDTFRYRISDAEGRQSNVATVSVFVGASPLQNRLDRWDVNADGAVTALDALLIINRIFAAGGNNIPVDLDDDPRDGTDPSGNPIWRYYDVSGDLVISALDALQVVNRLRELDIEPQAEGEAPAATVPAAAAAGSGASRLSEFGSPWEVSAAVAEPVEKIVEFSELPGVAAELIDTLAADWDRSEGDAETTLATDIAIARLL